MRRGATLLCSALVALAACGGKPPRDAASSGAAAADSAPAGAVQFAPSADGVQIAWHAYGEGDPALVLIHGWAQDSSVWREQIAPLAMPYRVVTLDLAGQGTSGAERRDWTLAHYAQDVAAVVAKLPNPHVILVGAGLGGPVALEAAPLVGSRLTGIIGVETFRTLGAAPPSPKVLDAQLQTFHDDFPGAVRDYVRNTLFHPQADATLVGSMSDLMSATPADRALAALTELNRLDYASILPGVRVPIVVLDSDLGGAPDMLRLQRAYPHLRVVTLGGDDGFPMLDDVARFNTTLLQAIASLATR